MLLLLARQGNVGFADDESERVWVVKKFRDFLVSFPGNRFDFDPAADPFISLAYKFAVFKVGNRYVRVTVRDEDRHTRRLKPGKVFRGVEGCHLIHKLFLRKSVIGEGGRAKRPKLSELISSASKMTKLGC